MTIPASRFVVHNERLFDSNNGPQGGYVVTYTGTARRHPWPARAKEYVMDGRGLAHFDSGDVYEGELRFGMFFGEGKMTYADGSVYDGDWREHLPHGFGILRDARTKSVYLGMFAKGDRHGSGEETFEDGTVFSGLFKFGKRSGVGRLRIGPTGDMIDGVYEKGRLNGTATVSYSNGDVFIGSFVRGKSHGPGRYTQCDSGDTYTELFHYGACVEGVLEDAEDPVSGIGGTSAEETVSDIEEAARRRNGPPPPPRRKVCRVLFSATKDEYCGEWQREGSGGNRRGVASGVGVYKEFSTGIVYEGGFRDGAKEGSGRLSFPAARSIPNVKPEEAAEAGPSSRRAISSDGGGGGENKEEEAPLSSAIHDEFTFYAQSTPSCIAHKYFANPVDFPDMHHAEGLAAIEADFHLGMLDGRAVIFTRDGGRIEGFFSKGLPHGVFHEHKPLEKQRFVGEVLLYYFHHGERREPDFHLRAQLP